MIQLVEKAIYFAHIDSYYILPLIGSIQLLFVCLFLKKKLLFLSLLTIIFISFTFPFAKLIPSLGSDAFLELNDFDLNEAFFYIKTLNFFAGWSKKHFLLWFLIVIAYLIFLYLLFFLKNNKYIDKFNLNTWHIPDSEITSLDKQNFRLIIPKNDGVNFN